MKKYLTSGLLALMLTATTSTYAFATTDIQFWHSMSGANAQKLAEITDKYNNSQSDYKINLVNKGTYPESMTAAIAAFRAGGQPHILQVYEVGTATFMSAGKAIYPVQQLMEDQGKDFDPKKFLPAITGYYSTADGRMLSYPFNSSTMVLYYNKDAFEKAGLDPENPPKTWPETAEAAKKLVESGLKCGFTTTWPSWANVENFSAWHNIPMGTKENGLAGLDTEFTIDNDVVRRHWNNLVKWSKDGSYTYGGRTATALNSFTSGTCGMLMESSGGRGNITSSAPFKVGINMMPYYDDVKGAPQNSIIGGASLWVMNGKAKDDYKGVADFIEYLSTPEVQAEWSQFTGYLPITTAAYELGKSQGFYEKNPGSDVAIKQINLNPPTENSKGIRFGSFPQIRTMFEEQIEQALNGSKTADQALKDAQTRGNEELRKFEAQQKK